MIGCMRTSVRKQPINALYFKFESELKFYNLEARPSRKSAYFVYTSSDCVFAKARLKLRNPIFFK